MNVRIMGTSRLCVWTFPLRNYSSDWPTIKPSGVYVVGIAHVDPTWTTPRFKSSLHYDFLNETRYKNIGDGMKYWVWLSQGCPTFSSLGPRIIFQFDSWDKKPRCLLALVLKIIASFHYLSQYIFRNDKLPWFVLKYKFYWNVHKFL
jgi:hypothetical protein